MADEDNYMEDFISMQGIYDTPPNYRHESDRVERRGHGLRDGGELDVARGLISAKTVFYIVAFTAVATAIVNPSLLIYTLPLSVLFSSILAMARRRVRREPRRIRVG